MVSLENKVVIITGASSGIGKAAAIKFAKKRAKVALAARSPEKLEELITYIHTFNKNCFYVKTDVAQESDVISLFDQTETKLGNLDILINNAGRGLKSEIGSITYDDWHSVINTNLSGVFLCTREAVKRMIRNNNRGHIITVSSVAGLFGAPGFSVYCASKHGVTGFKRSLKWELRKYGIKTSTIHPARVDTNFFDTYQNRPPRSQMLKAEDIAHHLVMVASQSLPIIMGYRFLNLIKRIFYIFKYR